MSDWTTNEKGRANSSDEFKACVAHVTRLIHNSAFDLIGGRAESVAGLIMAQLAHVRGLTPVGSQLRIDRRWLLETLERVIIDSDSLAGSLPADECADVQQENARLREMLKELGL